MILTKAEIEELVKKCEGHLEGPWFNGVIDRKTVQDLCWNGAFGVDVLIIADKPPLPESEATKIQLQAVAIMPVNNGNIEAIDIANCELLAASPALLSTCKDQAEKIERLTEALAWYADPANWESSGAHFTTFPPAATTIKGEKARAALSEGKGEGA